MVAINKAELVTKLQTLVNTAHETGSYLVDDIVATSLALSTFSEINIIQVSTKDFLPNLKYYSYPNGMIYYVDDLNIFAINSNLKWLSLDGRTIRQDSLYSAVWSWGCNTTGALGDNTVVDKSSPVSIINIGFTDWCQVSAGSRNSLAIRTNGTLWSWGMNTAGILGHGTAVTCSRSSPVSVIGGFTDWCQVSANDQSVLAVRTNGTAWAWGSGTTGRLGDNTIVAKSSPVSVVGGFTDWCQVSAGSSHSIGLRTNCTIWSWGCNSVGQLGDNTIVSKSSPVSIVGGFTDWCRISAATSHSLAIRTNGTAWGWGINTSAQLGDNTIVNKSSPVSVVGGFADWCQVSAGSSHSLGVRTNGTLWAWGASNVGQLGDNTIITKSSPVSVVGGFTDWCQVSAGGSGSLSVGIRTNGTAWSWGCNVCGSLGDNTIISRSSPVSIVGGLTGWCQISTGQFTSLGIISIT